MTFTGFWLNFCCSNEISKIFTILRNRLNKEKFYLSHWPTIRNDSGSNIWHAFRIFPEISHSDADLTDSNSVLALMRNKSFHDSLIFCNYSLLQRYTLYTHNKYAFILTIRIKTWNLHESETCKLSMLSTVFKDHIWFGASIYYNTNSVAHINFVISFPITFELFWSRQRDSFEDSSLKVK